MKRPSFVEGITVALIASLVGSILFTALIPYFSVTLVLRVLITLTGFSYSLYLLGRSQVRVGRVTAAVSWILTATLSWLMVPSLLQYLAIHLAIVWFIRSLYFYASLFSALTDLGLIVLGLFSALWAFSHTGSVFAAIWCLFLVQALFIFIPAHMRTHVNAGAPEQRNIDRFERAHNNARAALRRLSSNH